MSRSRPQPPRGPRAPAEPSFTRWMAMPLLALGVVVAFRNTLEVPFLLDDADSIANNPSIRSLATAWRPPTDSGFTVSGRPLLNLSLAVNHAIHGTSVAGYHVGNILIHLGAALCLFGVVRRTLVRPGLAERFGAHAVPLATLGAALWALHPMQTAAVTYIIQRAEMLVGLCLLGTLYAFIRSVDGGSRGWAVAAGVLCFLGMAAKEVMAVAPLVVFLYDRTFVSGTFREAWRRHGWLHLALAAGWLLLGGLIFASGARGGTVGFGVASWSDYVLTQVAGIGRYLGHVVYPVGLAFDYGPTVENRAGPIIAGGLVVVALVTGTLVLLRRAPAAGFLGAWFLLILAPTSSIIPVASQTLAEHRMYLPLAAVALAVVTGLYRLRPHVAWIALPILVVACATGTIARNQTFGSAVTLWEDTVAKVPYNTRAWISLGVAYLEAGRTEDALRMMEQAVEIAPQSAGVHADLALGLARTNRYPEAAEHYEIALRLAPNFLEARIAYGGLLRGMGRMEASMEHLRTAVQQAPDSAVARAGLGLSLVAAGRPEAAIPELETAVRLDPEMVQARYFLGDAFAEVGRTTEAIEQVEKVVALVPQPSAELLNFLGVLYARAGRPADASGCFRRVLVIDPGHTGARDNLSRMQERAADVGP